MCANINKGTPNLSPSPSPGPVFKERRFVPKKITLIICANTTHTPCVCVCVSTVCAGKQQPATVCINIYYVFNCSGPKRVKESGCMDHPAYT